TSFQSLGVYYISGTTLTVRLSPAFQFGFTVADAVLLQRLRGDNGLDDNFHLQANSPAVDRGDPNSPHLSEPAPNRSRVNLGYDGNTPNARTSSTPEIQVLSPNSGFEKYQQGQNVTLQWRTDGLTLMRPVALIDAGSDTGVDNFVADEYAQGGFTTSFQG